MFTLTLDKALSKVEKLIDDLATIETNSLSVMALEKMKAADALNRARTEEETAIRAARIASKLRELIN